MILCVGEILADMIGEERGSELRYERKAGGAPFNVACAVKAFGGSSAFVGCVGDDLIGKFLEDFAKSRKLDGLSIKLDGERNTTLAFVDIANDGERSFCFYRKNTADYMLGDVPQPLLERADIVHVGSLMLSEEYGRAYARSLMKRAGALGKTVSFDVNFRADIFRDRRAAVDIYREFIELADIVKLSEDELEIFGEKYIGELSDKLVCITLGGRGSEWRFGGRRGYVSSIKVKPVDTTGAGDAFYAGLLYMLDGKRRGEYTDEFLNNAFYFANVCGALNTLGKGAIDSLPKRCDIDSIIGKR